MSSAYAPPSGAPPTTPAPNTAHDEDPFDPPPAYTPTHHVQGETSLDAGPSRMDFSGPPPMPQRLESNITGVGVGYGRRADLGSQSTGSSIGPQPTGGWNAPPLPPRHPSTSQAPPKAQDHPMNSHAGPSRPPPPATQDLSPTEAPTPGRPLLWRGQLLVYPKGFWCHKCSNTGYKANDPSNPHEADWNKYGKTYNSALSISYLQSTRAYSNPSTLQSSNFQKPLPLHHPTNPYGHLPPPPGAWGTYPGQGAPPQQGQQVFVQRTAGYAPPGALVVHPGDPRIGGRVF
ncbi:uncharacterized protein IL334_005398 [Kwoniella shivajii]|uniref:Uncharacterized protein n=1 Tax=Kwoniella shivajii TaxID=564305 RepID=A0ABZ1D339_9TREE|nr:hypothetical protein IL334_005398 [Kwoniella shivajii]